MERKVEANDYWKEGWRNSTRHVPVVRSSIIHYSINICRNQAPKNIGNVDKIGP